MGARGSFKQTKALCVKIMIAFVINEITFLKLLTPIILYFVNNKIPYVLYHRSKCPGKPYNSANAVALKKSNLLLFNSAKITREYTNHKSLAGFCSTDKVKKFVSVETAMVFRNCIGGLKAKGIKLYDVRYLTDSMWQKNKSLITTMDKIYYPAKYIMEFTHKVSGVRYNSERDKLFGSPLFDCIGENSGEKELVLLANIRREHVPILFGDDKKYAKLIGNIINDKSIVKSRKKQYFPQKLMSKDFVVSYDGPVQYPTDISLLLRQTNRSFMFYSSGVFESVVGGNYVYNVQLPFSMWRWEKGLLTEYFVKSGMYNFEGVSESHVIKKVVEGGLDFGKKIDLGRRKQWVDKFVGPLGISANKIAKDILA